MLGLEEGIAFAEQLAIKYALERYERGEVPLVDHILVAHEGEHETVEKLIGPNRKFISFGSPFPYRANPQHLEVLWISSSGSLSR